MVHIQQGALRTFEQEIITRLVRVVEFPRDVCHHGLEKFCVVHGLGVDRIELHLAITDVRSEGVAKNELARPQKSCQHMVVQSEEFAQLCCKPFGVLEVVLRNALHAQLVERTGRPDWWADPRSDAQLLPREREAVADAVATADDRHQEPSSDDVVAAAGFGLWVGLLSDGVPRHPLHSYETALWQPRLRRAFPHYAGGRKHLHAELDVIRKTRNRVAHHEPIFRTNLALLGDRIATVAGHVDAAAETYIRESERLTTVLAAKRAFIADGATSF